MNNVLISWKGPEKNVFLMGNRKILPVVDGYVVVWTGTGTFFFQFLVNGQTVTAGHYPKQLKNGEAFNYIEVEPVPEEFSQIKFLTLTEIEIIDQEVFGPKGCGGKVSKISDYFQEAAEKIVSLLKMNAKRKSFKKILRSVRVIQRWIRTKYSKEKLKISKKNFPKILKAKQCLRRKQGKIRSLGRIVLSFSEFKRQAKKEAKVYQLNLRINKS